MSERAETLRMWVEADDARLAASDECAKSRERARAVFDGTVLAAKEYLRGYDDARAEMGPYIEKLERENEAMTGRVRELEAAQPAAVGVVGAVRWGALALDGFTIFQVETSREKAEMLGRRVVAIVDPDALVMLASRERVLDEATVNAVCDIAESLMYAAPEVRKMHVQRIADIFAQPAQERDA